MQLKTGHHDMLACAQFENQVSSSVLEVLQWHDRRSWPTG